MKVGLLLHVSTLPSWQLIEPYGAKLTPQQKDSGHNEFDIKGSCSSVTMGTGVRSSAVLRCPSPDYEPKEIKNIYVDSKYQFSHHHIWQASAAYPFTCR